MDIFNSLLYSTSVARENNGIPDIAIRWGSIEIPWYGIIAFMGFMVAIVFSVVKTKYWYKIPLNPLFYFIFIAIPVAILGARIWSIIIGDTVLQGDFLSRFIEFFRFQGLAIQGGVIFTLIAGIIYFPIILKKPKYQVRTMKDGIENVKPVSSYLYADIIIPCVLIGQAIGRWGNFINGELYGSPVYDNSLDWLKVVMPAVYDGMKIRVGNEDILHQPLFLYESFGDFWLFIILYVGVEFLKFHKAGDIGAGYFIGYGILRLIMEPLRSSEFAFVMTYVTSGLTIALGVIFIIANHLFLSKNRDKKILYMIYVKTSYHFKVLWSYISKSYAAKLYTNDPKGEKYGYSTKPDFTRKENEIFYYKGH